MTTTVGHSKTLVTASPLDRPAKLSVEDVPLTDGLELLYARSGVSLAFSPAFVPGERRVTCKCTKLTVGRALQVMLAGLPLESTVLDGDLILIAPLPAGAKAPRDADAETFTAAAPQMVGQISGLVTNSASGQPVGGVQVIIMGTTMGAMTRTMAGTRSPACPTAPIVCAHNASASRPSRSVTVAGADITADFAIATLPISLNEVG